MVGHGGRWLSSAVAGTLIASGAVFAATTAQAEPVPTERAKVSASAALRSLTVKPEKGSGYDRDRFKHWVDSDGDRCDTREEVLVRQSLSFVAVGAGCSVTSGSWLSKYDGVKTSDPSTFDIDHVVPLSEAWASGGRAWNTATLTAFANDLAYEGSLLAVTASSNRSKGDRDPAEWLPPNDAYHCEYVTTWIAVKHRWALTIDKAEFTALDSTIRSCGNPRITLPAQAKVVSGGSGGGNGGGGDPGDGGGSDDNFVGYTVHPGAYCSEHGAFGRTKAGTLMQCKTSATDSRYRWRAA
jgi:hypothetical protein